MQPSTVRTLVIGDYDYFGSVYPDTTTMLWTGWRPNHAPSPRIVDCTPSRFARAMRDVRQGRYDLVVTFLQPRPSWLPRNWVRSWAQTPLHPYSAISRLFGPSWLRWVSLPVPLVAMDMADYSGIGRHNFFLLDKAEAVFKRELPADRWQVLTHSAHPVLPSLRLRRKPRWQRRIANLHPIALPAVQLDTSAIWEGEFPQKATDIFFSGNSANNSWPRRTGMDELKELQARGYKVDIPATALPHGEFLRRMSQAWLAWSPSGFGWECNRTAEAAQCLTVPVVNHPGIERYCPLLHGTHLLQYDVEPGGLVRAVEAALADKERLKRMASAARTHVLAHHTQSAIVDHVITTALTPRKTGA